MFAYAAAVPEETTQAELSARGSSFYAAMRLMPARERAAMYEIYHFCHRVDDIADSSDSVEERLEALNQWRNDIFMIYARKALPLRLHGLADAIYMYRLRQEDFLAVIEGMEMDVRGPIQAPDNMTLARYCDYVACAVGRLSVRVFGMREYGVELAHHLGMALQLTNILRDLDEDAALGRLYLPRELLDEAGISGRTPSEVLNDPALGGACLQLAWLARGYFEEADNIMQRCQRSLVRAPRMMSQAYHAIHAALLTRGFACPRQKVQLGKVRLGSIVLRNLI